MGDTQTPTKAFDVDTIAEAIGRPSRRAVAKGAAWSLPVIATGIAAPAYAASVTSTPCAVCTTVNSCICDPNNPSTVGLCTSSGSGANCSCSPPGSTASLVCVSIGPLLNTCVNASLLGLGNTCGGQQCFGVCLGANSSLLTAVNTLIGFLTTIVNAIGNSPQFTEHCITSSGIPSNLCVTPANVGGLGSLCLASTDCGTRPTIGNPCNVLGSTVATTLRSVDTLLNGTLIPLLQTLGLLAPGASSRACATPFSCSELVGLALNQPTFNPGIPTCGQQPAWGYQLSLGTCQCTGSGCAKPATCP